MKNIQFRSLCVFQAIAYSLTGLILRHASRIIVPRGSKEMGNYARGTTPFERQHA